MFVAILLLDVCVSFLYFLFSLYSNTRLVHLSPYSVFGIISAVYLTSRFFGIISSESWYNIGIILYILFYYCNM